ncbi:LETM1-related biofilm-associated protein [Altibacter sp. HG106]|uniref:LETM1-related biofilm-associated protein n=1 Tax=Altibacter sp. HG106 TaxID=3023937 RepID=UPI00235071D8|nr:LETM1-related biofilm-associated protein [Altibacter sp. HG106]MDC7993862.1 LETM1-related biofilm-associated protein [Altibacter sp. HG106]
MNPSASGWIPKLCARIGMWEDAVFQTSEIEWYELLQHAGFLYGTSVHTISTTANSTLDLSQQERTKLNLCISLLYVFHKAHPEADTKRAIQSIHTFYQEASPLHKGLIPRFGVTRKSAVSVERFLSERLQEHNYLLRNKSVALLTHAFLFVDVLCYAQFLKDPEHFKAYQSTLETWILSFAIRALRSKKNKNKYDRNLLEWVSGSADFKEDFWDHKKLPFGPHAIWERRFLLEVCTLAVWDDRQLDASEKEFLEVAATKLELPAQYVEHTSIRLMQFAQKHAANIQLYDHSHPVQQFYKQATATVKLLILRNKKRLLLELEESGELLRLLGQSTVRDLSEAEKSKVRSQLLDICKTIPSLTIFLLPGGTVLLPLLMKFIPKLLPSAFNENKLD